MSVMRRKTVTKAAQFCHSSSVKPFERIVGEPNPLIFLTSCDAKLSLARICLGGRRCCRSEDEPDELRIPEVLA